MEVKNCPECGKSGLTVKIGGTNHKLRKDNKQLDRFVLNNLIFILYFI